MVVDVVGASPCGQASLARGNPGPRPACLPKAESARDVIAISGTFEAARVGDDVAQLNALPRPGHRHDHVLTRDHAEIAVTGLAGVHEKAGVPGGGKGGGQLLAHVSALPMPLMMTRPAAAARMPTARLKGSLSSPSSAALSAARPSAFQIERARR